jgi:hypothetical protein
MKSYDDSVYLMSQRISLEAAVKIAENHRIIFERYSRHRE